MAVLAACLVGNFSLLTSSTFKVETKLSAIALSRAVGGGEFVEAVILEAVTGPRDHEPRLCPDTRHEQSQLFTLFAIAVVSLSASCETARSGQ